LATGDGGLVEPPPARENYIRLATDEGTVPWMAEHEADLPPELRQDTAAEGSE